MLALNRLFIGPLIMIAVAAHHFILVEKELLLPWKGGGFAMFAVVDLRTVLATIHLIDGRRIPFETDRIAPKDRWLKIAEAAVTLPSSKHFLDVANTILSQFIFDRMPLEELQAIEIKVLSFDYDAVSHRIVLKELKASRYLLQNGVLRGE